MARSSRSPAPGPAAGPTSPPPEPGSSGPRSWQGVLYRESPPGAADVRQLFHFAGAFTPPASAGEIAWEALVDGRFCGGVILERHAERGFVHGPVVIEPPAGMEPVEVAAQLVAPLLEGGPGAAFATIFARPQGLDRVWVRFGFVPTPEAFLPGGFRGRPGSGLYVWRRPGTYTVPTAEERPGRRRAR